MPEAPKQNFFAKLFSATNVIDADQLCKSPRHAFLGLVSLCFSISVGEAAGKAPLGVAKKEDLNMGQLRGKADSASSIVSDTRMVSVFRIEQ